PLVNYFFYLFFLLVLFLISQTINRICIVYFQYQVNNVRFL
ncbi:hypothetical protein HMPREF0555_1763, partial [Leuconostoc mesenteroides subsp. cremoris ATCC 19254]